MLDTTLMRAALAACAIFCWSCDDGGGEEDDAGAGDAGADTDSDSDSDTDSDSDSDGGTDGGGNCLDYLPEPHAWDLGAVVPPESFPAIYGPDGPEATLDMVEAYCASAEVKSLVFVVGTKS